MPNTVTCWTCKRELVNAGNVCPFCGKNPSPTLVWYAYGDYETGKVYRAYQSDDLTKPLGKVWGFDEPFAVGVGATEEEAVANCRVVLADN